MIFQVFTWWQVNNNAVHTKKPDTACAVVVMRKMGWSGVSSGASGSHEMLGPAGDTVAGDPGTIAATETSPNRSDKGTSRLQSLGIWNVSGRDFTYIDHYAFKNTVYKLLLHKFRWIHGKICCQQAYLTTLYVTGNLYPSVTLVNKVRIMASLRAEPVALLGLSLAWSDNTGWTYSAAPLKNGQRFIVSQKVLW